jgi:hypothetical protein
MIKRTLTGDEIVAEIAEELRQWDGEFIAHIANLVLVPTFYYEGDFKFTQEIDE